MNGVQDSQASNVVSGSSPRRGRVVGWVYSALTIALTAFVVWRLIPHAGAVLGLADAPGEVPAFSVIGLDGAAYTPATLAGKVVLINGWATWCAPCRAEMPVLERMAVRHRARGLVVLGLSADTLPPALVADWVAARGITFPIAMGSVEDFRALKFGGALPTSWLLDKQGRVRHQVVGPIGALSLELAVRRLLDE